MLQIPSDDSYGALIGSCWCDQDLPGMGFFGLVKDNGAVVSDIVIKLAMSVETKSRLPRTLGLYLCLYACWPHALFPR